MKDVRILAFIFIGLSLIACTKNGDSVPQVKEAQMTSIESRINELKPGLGEIMSVIQQHHAKLYYSGAAGNWELASYQLDEIKEGLEQATELHDHFKDLKVSLKDLRHVMDQSLSEAENAILKKNKVLFFAGFSKITQSCNECHEAANHSFIIIKSPLPGMFSNQKFTRGIK